MELITAAMFVWWDWLGLQHCTVGELTLSLLFVCGELSWKKPKFRGYVQNDTSNLNCRETTHFRGEKDLKSVHDIIRPCYTAILV